MQIQIKGKCDIRLRILLILIFIVFIGQAPAIGSAFMEETAPAVVEAATPEYLDEIIYTVKPGDSVAKIASHFKINRWQLQEWNNINPNNYIKPGQELIIKHVEYPSVEGLASWYGPGFHGQNMANGEIYDMYDIIVAHRTLPLGTKVRITNLENGKSIIAPVLDRGPYVTDSRGQYTREIDLSYAVAEKLETIKKGVALARIEPIDEPLPIK